MNTCRNGHTFEQHVVRASGRKMCPECEKERGRRYREKHKDVLLQRRRADYAKANERKKAKRAAERAARLEAERLERLAVVDADVQAMRQRVAERKARQQRRLLVAP